ncbi:MAG TPA: hypothetical protein VMM60_17240 [Ilumatobacter sp.]|nr:hypothetical protein [Ilumatobacter sp.]
MIQYFDPMTFADATGVDVAVVGAVDCVAAVRTATGAPRLAATG